MDFFTNYDSPKSNEFMEHNQICATFHWDAITLKELKQIQNIKRFRNQKSFYWKNIGNSSNQSEIIFHIKWRR